MHVPFAGTGSASAFPAPSVGKAPAFSPALRRHLFGTPPAFSGHRSGIFSAAPQVLSQHLPPAFPGHSAGIFSAPRRHLSGTVSGSFRRLHLGLGAPQAPSSPNLPSRLLRHRWHPAEAPSRSGRTDLGSAAEGPRNQLQKRLSCSGSITSSTSPLARSISKSTPPPPVLGRPVVEISPPRGSAARRLPV